METIQISQSQMHAALKNLCAILLRTHQNITVAKDSQRAKELVDELRKISNVIDGKRINQSQYCYYLLRAFQDRYIDTIDEFATLYLRICIACDYETTVITKSFLGYEEDFPSMTLNKCLVDDDVFIQAISKENLADYALTYANFVIDKDFYKKYALVTQAFGIAENEKRIAIHGSNIPLSDIRRLPTGDYEIRLCGFELMKCYFKIYFWCPHIHYRFGVSTKLDIFSSLKDAGVPGRIVSLWYLDENMRNFGHIHQVKANTSLVTLHDIIHLSILTSYPKKLMHLVTQIVELMRANQCQKFAWSTESLSWKLIDFATSHEGHISEDNNAKLLASLLLSLLRANKKNKIILSNILYQRCIAPLFFCELLLLIKQKKLDHLLNANELMQLIGLDFYADLANYPENPSHFYFQLLSQLFKEVNVTIKDKNLTEKDEEYLKFFLILIKQFFSQKLVKFNLQQLSLLNGRFAQVIYQILLPHRKKEKEVA